MVCAPPFSSSCNAPVVSINLPVEHQPPRESLCPSNVANPPARSWPSFSATVFVDADQVSPSYSVDFVTHEDYFMQHKEKFANHLCEVAQSDVRQKMYFHASQRTL